MSSIPRKHRLTYSGPFHGAKYQNTRANVAKNSDFVRKKNGFSGSKKIENLKKKKKNKIPIIYLFIQFYCVIFSSS